MGFGSYDESDQRDPTIAMDDNDGEDDALHENDYEGTASFDSGASMDDLVEGLARIKEAEREE